ncbi:retrovirus-related Pol polyprotein from transposon opus [Nephila pilipes]|uniref:Retrovirus-related Pol polyprotein from transposon opus n=1 Tax=Nephila pilipes TaxID=299642 RepID=A0A8X6N8Q9_NEPPI|nr:retrovirus-related Pol polyprotein from transposon opus [Nephila pilipes]
MLQVITEERVVKEAAALLEAENVEKQREYVLEKLQLQLEYLKPHFQRDDKVKKEVPSEVVCYGSGTQGVIKPKCPSCKGKDKRNQGTFSSVILQSPSCPSKQLATLEVAINEVTAIACADTAATHSFADETLYHILKKEGTTFTTGSVTVYLADGSKIEREVNTNCVKILLGGRTLPLNLVVIPGSKNNNILLVMDFLESLGIVLKVKKENLVL